MAESENAESSDNPNPENLRDRNKRRARADIADVALRLFSERGFDAVTVDDITSQAGVAKRTFFRYFESKEDALLADYPTIRALLDASIDATKDGPPLASARATLHCLADYYIERRKEVVARSDVMRASSAAAARNLRHIAQWEDMIRSAIFASVGSAQSDLITHASAVLIVAGFRAALSDWLRSGAKDDLHKNVDAVFDLIEHGLATPFADEDPAPPV